MNKKYLIFILLVFSSIIPIWASSNIEIKVLLDWEKMIIGLLGGLALFLYGMDKLSRSMKQSAAKQMRSLLTKLTENRVIAFTLGALVTLIVQSSSATTVMLVSFVHTGLITFSQSLGVILGADVGTTVTAQLVAFKFSNYALLMIFFGFFIKFFFSKEKLATFGEVLFGFGILFFGMKLMSDSMSSLKEHPQIYDLLKNLENPLWGVLVGAFFTAIIQASAAFIGIVIVLGEQNMISLEVAIPLIMGANIGTCITAVLASIGAKREAKRVALAHVLFKVTGVLVLILWIPVFAEFVRSFTNPFSAQISRQIAMAHTIFNLGLGVVLLPFTNLFAKLIYFLFPIKAHEKKELDKELELRYLDYSLTKTPSMALDLARMEISRMAKILGNMHKLIKKPFLSDQIFPDLEIESIKSREDKLDFINSKVCDYLLNVSKGELTNKEAHEVYCLISVANDLENIGDIINLKLLPLVFKKRELQLDFSSEGKEELKIFHLKISKQISRIAEAVRELDPLRAQHIIGHTERYMDLESEYRILHLRRVGKKLVESVETHEVHMELMDLMKQINVLTGNMAYYISSVKT